MITVYQHTGFLNMRLLPRRLCLGSYFSTASAEDKLGWYFVQTCCHIERF